MSQGTQLDSYRRLPPPLLIGHRGLNTVAPENTLAAIDAASDRGAAGVEIDVRTCKSGQLVVFHDAGLGRMTGGRDTRTIASLDLHELQAVDLGGDTIPTLRQVIARCCERRLFLNVEMKRDVPRRGLVVMLTARALRAHDPDHPVVVSSFDPAMLLAFRQLAPGVPTALLIAPKQRWTGGLARPLSVAAVHPERSLVRAEDVARHHQRGRRVMTWTVNDVDEAERLLAAGVDGIISDDPERMAPVFASFRR